MSRDKGAPEQPTSRHLSFDDSFHEGIAFSDRVATELWPFVRDLIISIGAIVAAEFYNLVVPLVSPEPSAFDDVVTALGFCVLGR
jgi:hypothetical protein